VHLNQRERAIFRRHEEAREAAELGPSGGVECVYCEADRVRELEECRADYELDRRRDDRATGEDYR
jgi:hypothetical protein